MALSALLDSPAGGVALLGLSPLLDELRHRGLDRRHTPLQGDEVRACWEDGAVASPPDPVTPGLLDLLTVARLGGQPSIDTDEPGSLRAPRATAASTTGGSRRLWVEVEA